MKKKIVIILSTVILIFFFVLINKFITEKNRYYFFPIPDSNKYAYQVERIFEEDNDIVIEGWFFELKEVQKKKVELESNSKLGIILVNLNDLDNKEFNSNERYKGCKMNVTRCNRNSVNKYFDCEYDYSNCGFIAKIEKKDIDIYNGEYQVIFKTEETGRDGILSKNYIINGELKYKKNDDLSTVSVEGTDLEKIVNEGNYVAGSVNDNVFIFQYERNIYCIIKEEDYPKVMGELKMEYTLDTTQFDKLPEGRVYRNLSSFFERFEISDYKNTGGYRVAVREIPTEFSVYWISIGLAYGEKQFFRESFRPIYSFK